MLAEGIHALQPGDIALSQLRGELEDRAGHLVARDRAAMLNLRVALHADGHTVAHIAEQVEHEASGVGFGEPQTFDVASDDLLRQPVVRLAEAARGAAEHARAESDAEGWARLRLALALRLRWQARDRRAAQLLPPLRRRLARVRAPFLAASERLRAASSIRSVSAASVTCGSMSVSENASKWIAVRSL